MRTHPGGCYPLGNFTQEMNSIMDKVAGLVLIWLNPINLGIFLLCAAGSIWILSRTGGDWRDK